MLAKHPLPYTALLLIFPGVFKFKAIYVLSVLSQCFKNEESFNGIFYLGRGCKMCFRGILRRRICRSKRMPSQFGFVVFIKWCVPLLKKKCISYASAVKPHLKLHIATFYLILFCFVSPPTWDVFWCLVRAS